MKILVYGSLNIDMVFSVDHIVRAGETVASFALEKSAGGKGANQAAALAKAGMKVCMAGKIGEDGRFLLELLKSWGVEIERVTVYPGATGQALIQLDSKGQNAIILFAGGNGEIREDEIPFAFEDFGPGDAVLLQNEISCTGAIMEQAKKRGMKIFLNPSPFNETIGKLPLEKTDVFFLNEIEAAALASLPAETAPPEILAKLCALFPHAEIILTAGEDGVFYGAGSVREKAAALRVPVVDTTGAGDTFTGYYIAAVQRRFTVPEALKLACKAASITVSRKGAMRSIPFREEVFQNLSPNKESR